MSRIKKIIISNLNYQIKILFILGFFLPQLEMLGRNILFGFGNNTENQSRFYSEKNH